MKRPFLAVLALFALVAVFTSGCVHGSYSTRHQMTNTVALALTVNGTEQPTPAQWTAILTALEPRLSALGWVLVTDLSQADRIIRIDFTPNPLDPGSGFASVLSMTLNPRGPYALAMARANAASASYSYANYSPLSDPFLGYDRYQRWSDGSYSYSPPPAPAPTHSRHNPGNNRDDCPPGTTDRPTRYAGNDNASSNSSRNSGSSWGSSSNSSYTERSSYTPSSSSSMDSYHSSSSSSASYSAPAPSYSESSSYSSASSGGSSGTQDSKAQQN